MVGVGAVGAVVAAVTMRRGLASEIVLVDADEQRASGTALDLGYAAPLGPAVDIRAGSVQDLAGARLVIVTAGENEQAGGTTDRSDPKGRLRLLDRNAAVYRDLIPEIARWVPDATVMVVTDPPDPLAELARSLLGHERVFSTGTVIDALRFRSHLARSFGVAPNDVHAQVVGEHGTTEVFLWSSATIAGIPVSFLAEQEGHDPARFRSGIEQAVRFANIDIIEGIGASRYGIGAAVGALAQSVTRDECRVFPVSAHSTAWGTTLSLPSVVGARGVLRSFEPPMDDTERAAMAAGARALRDAASTVLA
ncbi:lactate/malate family dehydrogenase [Murinocardiopsis flavida]|uniref:lactate/malate family dehydrogenase n=1 Tax=Murinocardiopsis flavida TaxID=645275 RepID=UPI002481F9B1|nr:hypothetical protein [Murinocardiopsis flavida]